MGSWSYPQVNGGMGNVAVAHHSQEGRFTLGGDLWSWYETRDAARSWMGIMHGASGIGAIYSRGACYSKADPDKVYIAVGVLKSTGGYFGSCKAPNVTRHNGPQYGANLGGSQSTGTGAGASLPRPVGSLIDVSMGGGVEHIYTSAYNGLMHSTDGGQTWRTLFAHTGNWKAIAALDDTSALAALYHATGVTRLDSSGSHPVSAPGVIHDLRMIAGTCWAVGPTGVYRWSGSAFTKHAAASTAAGTLASTIDGSADGQVLLIGLNGPGSAILSTDGGNTWHQLGKNAQMVSFGGVPYWLATAATNGWGQPRFSASHAAVDKVNPQNMFIAGRGGGWGSHDGGATWHPAAPGGGEVTALRGGPGPDEFAGNDNDWTGWHTVDAFKHVTGAKTAQSGLSGHTSFAAGGHQYQFSNGDVKRDGQSIADDFYRGAAVNVGCAAASPSGKLLCGQYGGTLLLYTP